MNQATAHTAAALWVTVHSTAACRSTLCKEPVIKAEPARFPGVFSLIHEKEEAVCYREVCMEQTQSQLHLNLVQVMNLDDDNLKAENRQTLPQPQQGSWFQSSGLQGLLVLFASFPFGLTLHAGGSDKVVQASSPADSAEQQQSLRAEIPNNGLFLCSAATYSVWGVWLLQNRRFPCDGKDIQYFPLIRGAGTINIGLLCHWSFPFLGEEEKMTAASQPFASYVLRQLCLDGVRDRQRILSKEMHHRLQTSLKTKSP